MKDLGKGSAVVEAGIQEQQIALLEALDQLVNQFMFGCADLAVDETQWGAADQIKQATQLDGNSAFIDRQNRGLDEGKGYAANYLPGRRYPENLPQYGNYIVWFLAGG